MSDEVKGFNPKYPETIQYITPDDITKDFLLKILAVTRKDGKDIQVLPPNTKFTLDINKGAFFKYFKNAKDLHGKETTVGRFITNVFLLSISNSLYVPTKDKEVQYVSEFVDYTNKAFTKGVMEDVGNSVGRLLLQGKISYKEVTEFIDRSQWFGYTSAIFTLPSLDVKTLLVDDVIIAYKNKLLAENKEAIERNDIMVFNDMEKKLLEFAAERMKSKGAIGKYIYDSGYNGSWGNNFKTTSIWRGLSASSDNPNDIKIVKSNLVDGVAKEDLVAHADVAVAGAAGRAVDTRKGGYLVKIANAAYGAVRSDGSADSDCGTKLTREVIIDSSNWKNYEYRNIVENGKLIELDGETIKKYFGKPVRMRSPSMCTQREPCAKCLGNAFRRLQIRNVGLRAANLFSQIMNASMKSFHDTSKKPTSYNLMDYIKPLK